jgi:peroxiredoxin
MSIDAAFPSSLREVVALLLAGVIGFAGAAKLFDVTGTRRSVRDLGLPSNLGGPFAIVLPLAELAVAAALVLPTTSRVAAAAGGTLFAAFAVVIAVNVRRGRRVGCGCFGRLHSSVASRNVALRNSILALLAFAVAARPAERTGWAEIAFALAVAVAAAHVGVTYSLLRRYGGALRRIEQLMARAPQQSLSRGAAAPVFELLDLAGRSSSMATLLAPGRPLLLTFIDPGCSPCRTLLAEIQERRERLREITVAVVSRATIEENRELAPGLSPTVPLLQDEGDVFAAYGVTATPSAVLVEPDGRLATELVEGVEKIRRLLPSPVEPSVAAARPQPPRFATPAAAAIASGAALLLATAAPASRDRRDDAELDAIRQTVAAASPALARAARRSADALRKVLIFQGGSAARLRRARTAERAAAAALGAERDRLLALRSRLEALPATSTLAHNVQASAVQGLSLLAESAAVRKTAVTAKRATRERLLARAETLHRRALDAITTSARLSVGP